MSRFTRLAPAMLTAVAGAVAVRRSQRGWEQVIPATSTPVDHPSPRVGAPAPPGVDAGPPPKEEEPIPTQTGEGPGPDSPLDLPAPDWKASVKRAVKEFKEDRGTLTAAGMAFYWFLSVFPLLAAGAGMLGLFNVSAGRIEKITKSITGALPGQAGELLVEAVRKAAGASDGAVLAVLLGLALALWSASAGCVGMQMGLDVAYDVHDDRKFVKKRLVAYELMLAMLVLGGAATALIVFGAPLGDALRDNLPFGSAFVALWTLLRWAGGIAALTGL
ncbi:MAG TPA: YihY/virulence factor BrkB family protein, partial [Acidimicrobiales bacterium]|nr:YihY/virulence factor BrkB family protein [Acidimicrobiales bacterium]